MSRSYKGRVLLLDRTPVFRGLRTANDAANEERGAVTNPVKKKSEYIFCLHLLQHSKHKIMVCVRAW